MAMRAGDLAEPRHIERLRAEMVEVISASLAYPPFFDFRADALRVRPIDRAKVAEIEQFIGSANFAPIDRSSPSSPDTRHFLERLMLRYLDVNPALATAAGARFHSMLRAHVARLASDISRRFAAHLSGGERDFGARRQANSWATSKRHPHPAVYASEHNSRQLEAGLQESTRGAHGGVRKPGPKASPADFTVPTPAVSGPGRFPDSTQLGGYNGSPTSDLTDQPTGPVFAMTSRQDSLQNMRELPPDLLNLYGAYLGDMEPEAPLAPRAAPPPQPPRMPATPTHQPPAGPLDARGDQLIFWQLRYQLEAYVRLAARSYGLPGHAGDPSSVLDELRRSGFVDEADLRIAEGVFALTDRVTAQASATVEDYRQALMLYLLYHRSHINA